MRTKIFNEEPYGELICSHVKKEFPAVSTLSKLETVDAVARLLIGTKEVRYGSLPNPEHAVTIRAAIREAIDNDKPIPVLVPWGSIKADFSATLDIAEVSAVQRLVNLTESVKAYYPHGFDMVMRVEDTSGYTLFVLEEDIRKITTNINLYSTDIKKLVSILSKDSIRVQLESEMTHSSQFNKIFYQLLPLMVDYLTESWDIVKDNPQQAVNLDSFTKLLDNGWKGMISWEQRNHYIETYQRLYPNWTLKEYIKRLALYFTGSWTRFKLGMTGKQQNWNKFVQLSFVPPIKGLPEGYNFNYVYYRTLPLSEARTHMPPWRAKGYLRIAGNDIHHKITTYGDIDTISQLTSVKMELSDDETNLSLIVNADYLLES